MRRLAKELTLIILVVCFNVGCGGEAPAHVARETIVEEPEFIGDATCSTCHAGIAETYAQTNHKRGFGRFNAADAIEGFDVERIVYNEARNLHYEVFVDGDTLYQREFREDLNGDVIHERVEAADYVIGSGNATRSYLMENNGFLTEMPVTWYVEREYWEMSPGYQEANDRFGRKIILDCLTCHNAAPTHSPNTQNHFTEIPEGISCERCHGPASLHVGFWEQHPDTSIAGTDPTIVDPAYLDRGAQMSNCQQCHLAGVTVFREGQDPTTFRPGQELSENKTVFVPEQHLVDPDWVGIDSHPLRLARSACYRNSEMTCSTCHDPHRPKSLLPENYYNDRCLSCHGTESTASSHSCTRPGVESVEMAVAGDCVSCHMQKGGTSDVPHVSFSDHWIRKDPGPPRDPDEAKTVFETYDLIPLAALQKTGRSGHLLEAREPETPLEHLETAIAYFTFYEQMHRLPEYLPIIVTHARQGFAGGADHVEARIALARSLVTMDSVDAAIDQLRLAITKHPENAWVYFWLGTIQLEQGQLDVAIGTLQRAVTLQPYFMEARVKLGEALVRAQRLDEARLQFEDIVQRDPLHETRSWYNLGLIYLQQKNLIDGERALREASRLDPDLVDAHIQLGTLHLSQRRLDDAEKAFRKAIAADENNPAGYGSLATVFLQRGDVDRARQLLQIVLDLDPGNQAATALLARIRLR